MNIRNPFCLLRLLLLILALGFPLTRATAAVTPTPGDPFSTPFNVLRTEILTQLNVQTNGGTTNKPLVAKLKMVRTLADKSANSNLTTRLQNVGTIANTLGRTSLSNEFAAEIDAVLDFDADMLALLGEALSNRLAATFPGNLHNAAQNSLNGFLALLSQARTNQNLTKRAQLLRSAAQKYNSVNAAVTRAEHAPPPPSHFTATISASGEGTFKFSPAPAPAVATLNPATHLLNITAVNIARIGTTTVRTRNLILNIPNIADGTHTYNVATSGAGNANVVYTTATGGLSGASGEAYSATSGSVTVTINTAAKSAIGTFSFSGNGQGNSGSTASSNDGSFSVTYQ